MITRKHVPWKIAMLGVCLLCLHFSSVSHAFKAGPAEIALEPYVKGGTLAWDQLLGEGGHKFLIAGGVNAVAWFDRIGTGLNFEYWNLGEKLDDDKGIIPDWGYHLLADVRYSFYPAEGLKLYPLAGLGYEHWSRDDAIDSWQSIRFPYCALGGGGEYRAGYGQVSLLLPFAATADEGPDPKSRPGMSADLGVRVHNLTVGMFFRYMGFQDPDAKMVQAGLKLGYMFQ